MGQVLISFKKNFKYGLVVCLGMSPPGSYTNSIPQSNVATDTCAEVTTPTPAPPALPPHLLNIILNKDQKIQNSKVQHRNGNQREIQPQQPYEGKAQGGVIYG